MDPIQDYTTQTRRDFLATTANGIGLLAVSDLFKQEGLLADESLINPLAPKKPHFAPKAKNCIFIFMAGAPSQIDLFDPKPKLNELNGQSLPTEMLKDVRFAFIKKETVKIMGSKRVFTKHGQSGMELSDLLPHLGTVADDICLIRSMHTEAFNHHPGQLMMNTGVPRFGLPSVGSWLNYGLGSESRNLPGYVVLHAGRGSSGGASNWSSGFLPSTYAGVLFRTKGDAVLNLSNPQGISPDMQRHSLDLMGKLNARHFEQIRDPEINSRIASYELAYRMQTAAPELMDLKDESKATLEEYGIHRTGGVSGRGGGGGVMADYSRNCLLARRLVERGVRFVNLMHASWDHHSNLDNELASNAEMCDQPIAALINDLKRRGLFEETLVVWAAEFGRTPLGENRGGNPKATGRDHHPYGFSIWMAGGGVKGGQVIGATDEVGWHATEDKMHVNDLHATLLHLFGFNHEQLTYRFNGRDYRLTDVAGKVNPKILA